MMYNMVLSKENHVSHSFWSFFKEEITEAIDNADAIDVINPGFCKAFDKVPHRRLIKRWRDMVSKVWF